MPSIDFSDCPAEIDVLVVGAGMAGHAAAIAAREAGADVLLLEKEADYGGSSLLSGATFAFAGTPQQAEQGIEDDGEQLRADLLDVGGHHNDPAIVDLYIEHQLATYAWLRSIGVAFQEVQLSSNMSRPRSHPAVPRQIFACLRERLAAVGAGYLCATRAGALERDGAGRVAAVVLAQGDAERRIAVRGGTVLASGGFARNDHLVQTFVPDQAAAMRLGGSGSHGDGLVMGWALGADLADVGYIKATFGIAKPDYPGANRTYDGPRPLIHAMYRGGIAVNRTGRRFISEASSYKVLGDACLTQPDAVAFQIFDARVMGESREAPRTHDYAGARAQGLLIEANSIGALASAAGLDVDAVTDTVARYNAACEGREADAFGRTTLGMGYGTPPPLTEPPFYCYPCTSGLFTTYGGLRTDTRLVVTDVWGKPIDGLFAAGEVMGGFHGKGYMSGSAMGKAAVFGRLAGRHAAEAAAAV
ncbi:FAD-dependent oxidoreductase [Acuticoccus mangrovi]|uniref:FAD-binding protein n=1 Tax=Acuticoccus mangrovi TaxID=2796142 RepID=A0A934MKC3_9HYPH|nr:FAD-binding protein [Acuticoccus mangrovi]MBJ3775334.1 FAD-binding protein [Acuticoccus mangrovi]